MNMSFAYKQNNEYTKRRVESDRILMRYPNRIPVIVEKTPRSRLMPLERPKFLVPRDMTVGQFYFVIRQKVHLRPEDALFIFIGNTIPQTTTTMGTLYEENHDDDLFLYVAYSDESVYG